MAEPPSRDYAALLRDHLAPLGASLECPVCHRSTWEVGAPAVTLGWAETPGGGGFVEAGTSMPLLTAICRTCFHVRHFAWLPIARKAGIIK